MSDLMTFVAGAAVGTLVTYLAKNDEARKTAERFIDGMGASFTDLLHRLTPERTDQAVSADEEPESETVEKTTPPRKSTRGGRVAKAKKPGTEGKPVH